MQSNKKKSNSEITSPNSEKMSLSDQITSLKEFSSSDYFSLCWKLDRMNKDKNPFLQATLHFEEISAYPVIISEIKEWIILNLSQGRSESYLTQALGCFREMLEEGYLSEAGFFSISQKNLLEYYFFLDLSHSGPNSQGYKKWRLLKQFYKEHGDLEKVKYMNSFYLPESNLESKSKDKLIPEDIIEQLDRVFYYQDLPPSYKLIYWLLRLIPNRIDEVISIPYDCIFPVDKNSYILKLPTFKQAGAFARAQWRLIYLKDEGLGAYLKELIEDQQNYLQKEEYNCKFLIADYVWFYKENSFSCQYGTGIKPFGSHRFNQILKRIIEIYDVRDKDGNLAHVTSHMFRHNAVTERIDSGLFSFHDIKLMSGHHTTTMLEIAYNHPDFNKSKETVLSFEEEIPSFKGKVLPGASKEDFDKLASRPYAREIEGLGVCRDVRGCKAQYYKCYGCEYFKIESKDPVKLKEERTDWESKKLLAQRAGDKKFEDECDNNINGINTLLERIKNER